MITNFLMGVKQQGLNQGGCQPKKWSFIPEENACSLKKRENQSIPKNISNLHKPFPRVLKNGIQESVFD
jgi:hypothetical protein